MSKERRGGQGPPAPKQGYLLEVIRGLQRALKGAWLVLSQSVEHETLGLGAVGLSPILGVEITYK